MDPLSIIAGTVGIADVSVRIIAFLVDIKEASEKIQDEITILSQEVSSLLAVNESVEDFFHSRHDLGNFEEPFDDDSPAEKLWKNVALLLQQSKVAIEQLETLLREVVGKKGNQVAGKIDGLRKTIRRKGRDGDYMQLRQRLVNFQSGFQMLLNALNLYYTLKSHPPKDLAVGNLSENLRRQNVKLQSRIGKLRRELKESSDSAELYDSLVSADAVASLIRFNEHFYTPQNVSSYYTGRQKQLDELASILNVTSSRQRQTHQKRFIITGLGGSGKTQFCCKFAQDNRENFWGIFWIDGSSSENAQHSFAKIAKIGGREPNENAAKSWLSSLQHPWLLLIDNADDPEADLMRYFPSGERGVILITTRNPTNIRYGTEDKLCFHFEKLEEEEASDLLLAAAAFPRPWGVPTKQQAVKIAQVLGYLPLALIHAGKAILEKLCSLGDYTEYYERSWNKIRLNRSRSPSRGREVENTSSMRVYSSYEMIYVGLETSIYGFMGEDQLLVAHQMSDEVLQIRIKELGHEHPFTLKTMLTLAKIKTALNQFDDAEAIFLEGLPAAERNLGKSHLGTITGRIWLAHLYWRQGRYAEAGAIWEDVIEKRNFQQSKREDGEHGDRAQAMWFLVHCYEDQGRLDEALELCQQLQKLLRGFGGDTLAQQHKLWKYVEEKTQQLKQLKTQPPDQALHPPNANSYHVPPKRVIADCTY
ncbi:hypothetical protein V2A60_008957 [Cordyceps javanica]